MPIYFLRKRKGKQRRDREGGSVYETGEEAKGHCPLGTSLCGKSPPADVVCCSSSCLVAQRDMKRGHAAVG